jgi:MFS family permease
MIRPQYTLRAALLGCAISGLALLVIRSNPMMSLPALLALFVVGAVPGGFIGYSLHGWRGAFLCSIVIGITVVVIAISVFIWFRED